MALFARCASYEHMYRALLMGMGGCRVDESHLTGESDDVLKHAYSSPVMLSGTKVLEGCGRMLITGVGLNSAQGRILGSLTDERPDEGAGLR